MTESLTANPKRILIVDDEQIVAMDTEMQLLALGFDVVGLATTSKEAISQMEATSPDLVLMDIKLRGSVDGIATAEAMQCIRPIPVVFVTAFGSDEARRRVAATDSFGYLVKPYRPEDLQAALNIAFRRTQSAAAG